MNYKALIFAAATLALATASTAHAKLIRGYHPEEHVDRDPYNRRTYYGVRWVDLEEKYGDGDEAKAEAKRIFLAVIRDNNLPYKPRSNASADVRIGYAKRIVATSAEVCGIALKKYKLAGWKERRIAARLVMEYASWYERRKIDECEHIANEDEKAAMKSALDATVEFAKDFQQNADRDIANNRKYFYYKNRN